MLQGVDVLVEMSLDGEVWFRCYGRNREVLRERFSWQLRREDINERDRCSEHLRCHADTDE